MSQPVSTLQTETSRSSSPTILPDEQEIEYDDKDEVLAGKYSLQKVIGHGTYGTVRLARDAQTNGMYAIKILTKEHMKDAKHVTRVQREIRFLKLLHHPHIVKVKDVYESARDIFIVMEHVTGGELFDYIVSHGRVKEKEARRFFRQIVSAVKYCHQNSVIHRDLKPENLLLDEHKNIKLIDLGFANNYKQSQLLETYCGSPNYAAPEMISGQKYNGPEVDIWSLGIILYALVCGCLPFEDKVLKKLCQKIVRGEYDPPDDLTIECLHLISRLLDVNPDTRATLDEIFEHEWVNYGYEDPPQSYVPTRSQVNIASPNGEALKRLQHFGFKEAEIMKGLTEPGINPISSTYHLIVELMERERKRALAVSMELLSPISASQIQGGGPFHLQQNTLTTSSMPNGLDRRPSTSAGYSAAPKVAIDYQTANANPRKLSVAITRPVALNTNSRRSSQITPTGAHNRTLLPTPPQSPELENSVPPRTISGWFVTYSTTSNKPPPALLSEVISSLEISKVSYQRDGWLLQCSTHEVQFSLEIVLVSRLGICGLIYKRNTGTVGDYRDICSKVQAGISI